MQQNRLQTIPDWHVISINVDAQCRYTYVPNESVAAWCALIFTEHNDVRNGFVARSSGHHFATYQFFLCGLFICRTRANNIWYKLTSNWTAYKWTNSCPSNVKNLSISPVMISMYSMKCRHPTICTYSYRWFFQSVRNRRAVDRARLLLLYLQERYSAFPESKTRNWICQILKPTHDHDQAKTRLFLRQKQRARELLPH